MGNLIYSTIRKGLLLSLQILIILSCAKTSIEIPEQKSDAFRTEDQIRNIAVNAFEKFYGNTKSEARVSLISGITLKSATQSDSLFYVVNFDENGGFVIVGARKVFPEVIAICNKGNYLGIPTDNPGFNFYIDSIEESLSQLLSMQSEDYSVGRGTITETITTSIDPMVEGVWHQHEPFNLLCPTIRDTLCPTGCVPLAMAMAISKYEYPTTLSVTFPDAAISSIGLEWDDMKSETGNHGLTCDICKEKAHLLRELGYRLNVSYSPTGSSAQTSNIVSCLTSLGFTSSYYNSFDINSVDASLTAYRPVVIRGQKTVNGVVRGHAWVIDGEEHTKTTTIVSQKINGMMTIVTTEHDTYYLHFNFGWGGSYDGYFLSWDGYTYTSNNGMTPPTNPNIIVSCFSGAPGYTTNVRIIPHIRQS